MRRLTPILILMLIMMTAAIPAAEARTFTVKWSGVFDWGFYEALGLRTVYEVDPIHNVVLREERLIPIVVLPEFNIQIHSNFKYYKLSIYDDKGVVRASIGTIERGLRVEECKSPDGELLYYYPPEPERRYGGGCGVAMKHEVSSGDVVLVRVDVRKSDYSEPGRDLWVEARIKVEIGGRILLDARILDYMGLSMFYYVEAVNASLPIGSNAGFAAGGGVPVPSTIYIPFAVQDSTWEPPLSFRAKAWGPYAEVWGATYTPPGYSPRAVELDVEAVDVYRGLLYIVEIRIPALDTTAITRTYSWVETNTYTWQGRTWIQTETRYEYTTQAYNLYRMTIEAYDARGELVAQLTLTPFEPAEAAGEPEASSAALLGLGLLALLLLLVWVRRGG